MTALKRISEQTCCKHPNKFKQFWEKQKERWSTKSKKDKLFTVTNTYIFFDLEQNSKNKKKLKIKILKIKKTKGKQWMLIDNPTADWPLYS